MQFPLAPSPPGMRAAHTPKPRAHAGQGRGDVPSQGGWAESQIQLQHGSRKGRTRKRPLSLLGLRTDTLEKGKGCY